MKKIKKQLTKAFYKSNRLRFIAASIITVLLALTNLPISWLLQQVIDCATGSENAYPLGTLLIVLAALFGTMALLTMALYYTRPRFISRAIMQYKDTALEHISQKGIDAFRAESTSLYTSALSNDTAAIEKGYLESGFEIVSNLVMFVGAFIMMLCYSPLLTLVTFGFSALPVAAALLTGGRIEQAEKRLSDKNEGYIATLTDCLAGFSVIKSFRAEARTLAILAKANRQAAEAKCLRERVNILLEGLGTAAGGITQFGVFMVSAYLALTGGGITAGVMVIFVQLINYVINPIATLPGLFAQRKAAKVLIEKLAGAVSDNTQREGTATVSELKEGIELRAVTYGYGEGAPVLRGLNASLEAGKSYALVGASGSGKSTLLRLLMASDPGFEGDITYDGVSVRDISTESLYDLVSVVEQNVFIFNASIRDNITMFGDFPEEEVSRALELSGLSSVIEQKGADYLCGENGCGLSGGEKQRVSIARSLLRKSRVLLADEATSALDRQTAFRVSDAMLSIPEVTCISVNHTLDSDLLRRYDCILALKAGSIIESGSFDELMTQKGYFYSLYTVSA